MNNSRKHLKINSIIILIFAACTLLNIIAELFFGDLSTVTIPDGAPNNIVLITQIFMLVFSAILLLPQIYIGFKGIKVAKKPDSSKAHIVWAIILFVCAVITLLSSAIAMITTGDVKGSIAAILSVFVEVAVYFDYIKHAKIVAKNN